MKKLECKECLNVWYVDDYRLNDQKYCPCCCAEIMKEIPMSDVNIKKRQVIQKIHPQSDIIDSGKCGDNATWALLEDGMFIISGSGDMYDYEYNIETGTTNSDWFKYNIKIKTVEIENGITSIGEGAFFWCIILTNITIPDSVTTIGKYAFGRCGSLTNITIPESVTSIGESIFYCCSPLKEIKIHKSGRENMRNWDKDWKGYNCYAKIVYI